ncbi:MAG: AraC family transcriptional regulator [bacterium]|nr:AraC family transcriptional regulator [bacterium]
MKTFTPKDVFAQADFPLRVERTKTISGRYPLHGHGFTELEFVMTGTATEMVNGVACQLAPGDVYVLHPGEIHNVRTMRNFETCFLQFLPEKLVPRLEDLRQLPGYRMLFDPLPPHAKPRGFSARIHLDVQQLAHAQTLHTELHREMLTRLPGYQHVCLGLFLQLLTFLCRQCDPHTQQSMHSFDAIAPAIGYIEQHAHEAISLAKLAHVCALSSSTLSRQFRKITGHAPIEYLIRRRVLKSTDLLHTENLSITDVAFQSGFDDSNYYTRQFKHVMGVTPRAYRARASRAV